MFHDIPYIFLPISLRSGTRWRSLRLYKFVLEEKKWLVEQILKRELEQPSTSITVILDEMKSRYDLNDEDLQEWVNLYSEDLISNVQSNYATVCPMGDEGIQAVFDWQFSGNSTKSLRRIIYKHLHR